MKKKNIQFISFFFPTFFAQKGYHRLTHPHSHKLRPHEEVVLDKAEKSIFKYGSFDIQMYEWKAGPEQVLLIHGWEGQAGNFADLIEKFLENNISVVAFDGPSHGQSSSGNGQTSLFQFAELVGVLVRKTGIKKLVSHSFGGVATTYSLSKNPDLKIEKYALFTTPNRFVDRIDVVAEQVGLHGRAKKKLFQKLEKELNLDLSQINVEVFVQNIQVEKALIVHDTYDKVLSVNESREVAKNWSQAQMKEVEGTGHFRILRTDEVLQIVLDFMEFDKKG